MSHARPRHPLDPRLNPIRATGHTRLEGPDAEGWEFEPLADIPEFLVRDLPPGALAFAHNGSGDHLFLAPHSTAVMVFWHEGPEVREYASSVDDLLPNVGRPPSAHGAIRYAGSDDVVRPGDIVRVRYWLVFSGIGSVSYVPGISPLKRALERDGLAWVRIALKDGTKLIDSIVIDGRLQKGVRLLTRAAEPIDHLSAEELIARDLARVTDGGDSDEMYAAIQRLKTQGPRVAAALRAIVGDSRMSTGARGRALDVLGALRPTEDDTATLLMSLATTDSSASVRWSAVGALGALKDPRAIAVLERIARDDDAVAVDIPGLRQTVRDGATEALRRLREPLR